MDFVQIVATLTEFLQTHLLISIAVLTMVVAFLFYKNPVETFKFLAFVAIMAIIGYFILQLGSSSDSGVNAKEELSNKTKKAIGE